MLFMTVLSKASVPSATARLSYYFGACTLMKLEASRLHFRLALSGCKFVFTLSSFLVSVFNPQQLC